ncbi:hypothetical protein [Nonomuraea helvata]|uniref:DoxX family membrane protein n=1 Tax=Nonomuraea helvata TaxID=37484 RepID=A0ABV5S713_9ACTN
MDGIAALALALLLIVTGIMHWVFPTYFRTLVPAWVPLPGAVVAVSGAIEVVVGAFILLPTTRAMAAWVAAVLITGYLVSHVDALVHTTRAQRRWLDRPAGVTARIVVNLGYIAWAAAVASTSAVQAG